MRIFLTGASGWVGSAVTKELQKAGHKVIGLARSDVAAKTIHDNGAEVLRGDLTDLETLKKGAANSDGVIHNGFVHDFSQFAKSCEIDRNAIEAMSSALAGSNRPLVITSGTALVSSGKLATEDNAVDLSVGHHTALRGQSEVLALKQADRGVRVSLVRLPPSVHGAGDYGFISMLIKMAREKGVSAYIGEGKNVWPAVHRFDTATVFKLAMEKGVAGSRFHAVAEQGVEFRKIAEIIGQRLNIPVVSIAAEKAAEHFTWFGGFAALDNPTSSTKTQQILGWKPTGPGLIADIDQDAYFKI